jgi:hypothetical protein
LNSGVIYTLTDLCAFKKAGIEVSKVTEFISTGLSDSGKSLSTTSNGRDWNIVFPVISLEKSTYCLPSSKEYPPHI